MHIKHPSELWILLCIDKDSLVLFLSSLQAVPTLHRLASGTVGEWAKNICGLKGAVSVSQDSYKGWTELSFIKLQFRFYMNLFYSTDNFHGNFRMC